MKKAGDLEAEVVALAPFPSANVCAAFSTDPVKTVVFPFGGGQPQVQSVSLDACESGALIDERVAVVKSGDELWGLVDLQHKPRIERVVPSVRAVFNNAGSKSALAFGWGDEGYELMLQGNEVVAREFQVRGTVRACSLDGVSCYVVADDGGGGGKFREHPGNTPESGTHIRCELPLAAKEMDRLAAGPQLAALVQKGGSTVCVIRKVGAAALDVKIVSVDTGIVDIAVLETTLFVLTDDGDVRVFGADALQRSSDGGPAVPNFALAMGAGSAPTALAASSRGGNRLWIGTKDGEVFRCDCVKGAMTL
jgi:hypothetical protein